MPAAEPTIEPSALRPAKIGTSGKTPPSIVGNLIVRGFHIFFPFFDWLIERTATSIAESIFSGRVFLIAVFAFLTKAANEIKKFSQLLCRISLFSSSFLYLKPFFSRSSIFSLQFLFLAWFF